MKSIRAGFTYQKPAADNYRRVRLPRHLVSLSGKFFALAYSLKGLRFKEIPIVDSITSSLHFVGPLVYALTWTGVNQAAWLAAIAFFLWGMASHAFGAVQDIKPDREAEINSIATQLGARFTVRLALVAYLLASITVSLIGPRAWPVALAGLLYVVNVWPYRLLNDENSDRANRGWRRFLWLNMIMGAVVTISCVAAVVV
ncbi:hypothetical protein B7Y92_03065 [Candidatus Saccharibacteria bacterium 32-50-13]|nr:MAG: hypothetical protein B7Y92_03065 [Candidatus Saccharibacteria bacterium 32-50-13]